MQPVADAMRPNFTGDDLPESEKDESSMLPDPVPEVQQ